jgi:arylamine N-acetyltransferase
MHDESPSLAKLEAICETHLEKVPFENLSQHGIGEPAILNVDQIASKTRELHRGGFCFEGNGLLAEFLFELRYELVRVIAHVYKEGSSKTELTKLHKEFEIAAVVHGDRDDGIKAVEELDVLYQDAAGRVHSVHLTYDGMKDLDL